MLELASISQEEITRYQEIACEGLDAPSLELGRFKKAFRRVQIALGMVALKNGHDRLAISFYKLNEHLDRKGAGIRALPSLDPESEMSGITPVLYQFDEATGALGDALAEGDMLESVHSETVCQFLGIGVGEYVSSYDQL